MNCLLAGAAAVMLCACGPVGDGGQPASIDAMGPTAEAAPRGASALPAEGARHWQCGDLRVTSRHDPARRQMTLWMSGRTLELQAGAADAARFESNGGHVFEPGSENATLVIGGVATQCSSILVASPWYDAAARGVRFRAAGNEPGWWVEVGSGTSPSLTAVLDYGERRIDIPQVQATRNGFSGATAAGARVRVTIDAGRCSDVMSGEAFDARVQLVVDDTHRYQGCGAFLVD